MAKFPAMPLFTDAFISDTMHLNAAQTGAYLMLLMCAWRTKDCALPDDDKLLARYARMNLRTWKANKDIILEFWVKDKNQKFTQKRLLDERKYVSDKVNKNSLAGKASALKRKERDATDVQPNVNQNPTPTPTPTHSIKDISKDIYKKPENVGVEVWDDFKKLRKAKKAVITKTAINGIGREAQKAGITLEDALRICCERGWQGFKADWINKQGEPSYGTTGLTKKRDISDELDDSVDRVLAEFRQRDEEERDDRAHGTPMLRHSGHIRKDGEPT